MLKSKAIVVEFVHGVYKGQLGFNLAGGMESLGWNLPRVKAIALDLTDDLYQRWTQGNVSVAVPRSVIFDLHCQITTQ